MSPGNDERRPCRGAGTSSRLAGQDQRTTADRPDAAAEPDGLFAVIRSPSPPDMPPRVSFALRADDEHGQQHHARGPGPRRTAGPQDAGAPAWWTAEATQVVMRLVREHGEVTSDDVRDAYPDLPSATGAAIGAMFKRLGRQGRLVLVAHRPSSRPEARGRVVGVWRSP